jgi:hypothetical protein
MGDTAMPWLRLLAIVVIVAVIVLLVFTMTGDLAMGLQTLVAGLVAVGAAISAANHRDQRIKAVVAFLAAATGVGLGLERYVAFAEYIKASERPGKIDADLKEKLAALNANKEAAAGDADAVAEIDEQIETARTAAREEKAKAQEELDGMTEPNVSVKPVFLAAIAALLLRTVKEDEPPKTFTLKDIEEANKPADFMNAYSLEDQKPDRHREFVDSATKAIKYLNWARAQKDTEGKFQNPAQDNFALWQAYNAAVQAIGRYQESRKDRDAAKVRDALARYANVLQVAATTDRKGLRAMELTPTEDPSRTVARFVSTTLGLGAAASTAARAAAAAAASTSSMGPPADDDEDYETLIKDADDILNATDYMKQEQEFEQAQEALEEAKQEEQTAKDDIPTEPDVESDDADEEELKKQTTAYENAQANFAKAMAFRLVAEANVRVAEAKLKAAKIRDDHTQQSAAGERIALLEQDSESLKQLQKELMQAIQQQIDAQVKLEAAEKAQTAADEAQTAAEAAASTATMDPSDTAAAERARQAAERARQAAEAARLAEEAAAEATAKATEAVKAAVRAVNDAAGAAAKRDKLSIDDLK